MTDFFFLCLLNIACLSPSRIVVKLEHFLLVFWMLRRLHLHRKWIEAMMGPSL